MRGHGIEYRAVYSVRVLVAAWRQLCQIARADTPTHAVFRARLTALATATLGVDTICTILAFLFERHAHGTQIDSLGSAAFWSTTQLLTISSSMSNPVSTPGRVLDVVIEAYAFIIGGALAGTMGAFLVRLAHDVDRAAQGAPPTASGGVSES